ncbi:two-component system capsular synthesis sensor histidine kinase RcsC [Paraburkholderia sp. HC6.4b]|uniref:ATP-binding protein n=1 Tax=unclassified Paraburkholderia TaxID=2615204 RepID=UPI00160A37FB|nr:MULTISPECIES: ATP-binding protein [unclassified Paraburkholderia]MBB5412259.1 two-component system capsular synthesis sensor histidine kinase RcsC [Paraburkholderia sp. HC6.4b]MBB5454326.1 two-component system capsular synthesis sensor histidine kinase RcsC [Paraburkholderia sp. Kb1A]
MSSAPQNDALNQLQRYKKLLVFGGGLVTTIMMLFAFTLAALSAVRGQVAAERQNFLVDRNLVMSEVNSSEALFRSALVSAELAWQDADQVDLELITRFRSQGYAFVPLPMSTAQPPLLFDMPGKSLTHDERRRYLGLTAQLGRVSAVNSLVRGQQASRYFYGARHNIAGILSAPLPPQAAMAGTSAGRAHLIADLGDGLDGLAGIHAGEQPDNRRPVSWMLPAISPLTGKMAIRIAAPVFSDGSPFAILVTEYDPEILTAPLTVGGFDGTYMVVSEKGEIVASTAWNEQAPALIDRVRALGVAGATGSMQRETWRDGVFTIADRLGDTGWVLVYVFTWRDVVAGIGKQIGIGAVLTLATLAVVWGFLIYLKQRVFRPAIERSRRVFESEHLSRMLVETAPVGLGLIAVESGKALLRSPTMIDAAARVVVPTETLSAELVRRHRERGGATGTNGMLHEELTLPTREGGAMDLSVSVVPARYQGQDVLVTAFTDVTAGKRLERQLRDAKQAADSANAAKSAFLAAMSHEIRTPLNAIMGNLELLSRSQLDALQRDRLTTIRASADGLLEVVSDVLDFSRSEAGEMRLERIAFDAQEVASRALLMFGPLARAKGVRLSGVFGTSPVLPMQGDPTRLGQVMNNLLANAIKFTAYGEVTLRLSVEAGVDDQDAMLTIEVEDSGIGMSSEQQALLFQAFSQTDATINRRFGGTGLGLALCARLIDAMGGTIAVRSEPGQGSCFTARVPLGESEGESDMPRFAGERILFVAAADAWHTYAVAALEAWGLQVQAYRHPAQLHPAMLNEADALILCGERDTWHADDESGLLAESSWVIDSSTEGPAYPVAVEPVVRVSSYSLKGLVAALRYTLQGEALQACDETQQVLSSRRLKVLIAEDNAVNRQLFEEQLRMLGCETRAAEDGRHALDWLSRERFDVLLTDLSMPVLDGYALAREAQVHWPEMPIVAATASATLEVRTWCEATGMARVVTKPLQLDELSAVLSEVTGVPRVVIEADGSEPRRDGMLGGRAVPEQTRETFRKSCEASLRVIRAAHNDGDATRLLAELHSLRGALAVFGHDALADQCARLEMTISKDGVQVAQKMIETLGARLRTDVLTDTKTLREVLAEVSESECPEVG